MSWSSRFGSWSGRFSPFGRGDTSSTAVSDADFSYITSEDLAASQKNLGAAPHASGTSSPASSTTVTGGRSNANGETDVLVLKHKRVSYPVHFPRGAIDSGELGVRNIREAAARKMDVDDPRRIKLFYKGRQLKDDQPARAVGLRSDMESEILCVVGEGLPFGQSDGSRASSLRDGAGDSGSDSDSGDDDEGTSTPGGSSSRGGKKKKRNRRGGRKHKKSATSPSTPEPSSGGGVYVGGGAGSEFLGVPVGAAVPPRPSSSSSNTRPPPPAKAATTPMEKLEELSSKFHTTLVPLCVQFINRPPDDKAKLEFEHKKLTETVLAQVLLKLDAVETSGDEAARARRKQLVKECNGMLTRLDEVMRA